MQGSVEHPSWQDITIGAITIENKSQKLYPDLESTTQPVLKILSPEIRKTQNPFI